jgi:hypothetical protein
MNFPLYSPKGFDIDTEVVPIAKDKNQIAKEEDGFKQKFQSMFERVRYWFLNNCDAKVVAEVGENVLDIREGIVDYSKRYKIDVIVM